MKDLDLDDVAAISPKAKAELEAIRAENERLKEQLKTGDKLRADLDGWLRANGPDGWIDKLRKDAGRWRLLEIASLGFEGAPSWSAGLSGGASVEGEQ